MKKAPHILAVDDQPANLLLVKRVLEPAGFEVRQARSGGEALAMAQESLPDLILLDMHLPDMHGLDVLRRLQESTWGPDLRVVAMSALPSPEDQALWLRSGCVGSIEKPITVGTFVQTVSQWLPGGASADGMTVQSAVPARDDGEIDKLGEILVANDLITVEQLREAIEAQAKTGRRLGQVLVDQGKVSEDDIAWALSNQLGYPYVYLTRDIIDEDAARLLPEAFLRERLVLPILRFDQEMTLAMADPTDQHTVNDVVGRTKLQVKRALALASNIDEMLAHLFAHDAAPRATAAEAQYMQFHLAQATQQGASEIHFDPAIDGQARVRYRLQGVLIDRASQPANLHTAILAYLRDLGGAGGAPSSTATAAVRVGQTDVHLTTTFLPTSGGPAATVVLHPRRADVPSLAPLGVPENLIRPLREAIDAAHGVVVVGCGDRLLRSALLHALIPLGRGKTWTLETIPIYHRPTLNQTTPEGIDELPSLLHKVAAAGPDVIAVDDVSRREAIIAAMEVGRTRMVLAAHPQDDVVGLLSQVVDAAGAALVASTLRGILAARAVRLLCPVCKKTMLQQTSFEPQGCEACSFTGFRGQRVLSEVWIPDAGARFLLRSGQVAAIYERLIPDVGAQIRAQGLALIEDGLTSLNELARIAEGVSWT